MKKSFNNRIKRRIIKWLFPELVGNIDANITRKLSAIQGLVVDLTMHQTEKVIIIYKFGKQDYIKIIDILP